MRRSAALLAFLTLLITNSAARPNLYSTYLGGTSGLGMGCSMVWGRFVGKVGGQAYFVYDRNKYSYGDVVQFATVLNPCFDVGLLLNKSETVRFALHASLDLQVRYDSYDFNSSDTNVYLSHDTSGFRFSFLGFSPGLEVYWFKDGQPKVSASFGCVTISPHDLDHIRLRALCCLSVYLRIHKDDNPPQKDAS